MVDETETRRIIDTVLSASRADQTEVPVFAGDSALPRPEAVASVEAWVERTARCGPEERAAVVGQICDASSRAGLVAAGAFHTAAPTFAVGHSPGGFAPHRDTQAG